MQALNNDGSLGPKPLRTQRQSDRKPFERWYLLANGKFNSSRLPKRPKLRYTFQTLRLRRKAPREPYNDVSGHPYTPTSLI